MTETIVDKIAANAKGGRWMLVSIVGAAAMTLAARAASEEIDSILIVMLRSIGGLALCAVVLAPLPRHRQGVTFSRPWLHIARGAMVAVSTQLGFYTITQIPLATATVLFFSAPIFTTLLAPFVLGEQVGIRRLGAVFVGFFGVLIIVRPDEMAFEIAHATALLSSFLFALVLLMSRAVANRDGAWATYISSAALTILISAPLAVPIWALPVTTYGWLALAVVTLASMIRNIADIEAYRSAEASFLAPLAYTRIILIAVGAYFFFDETPDANTILGGMVIISAALYIARREALKRGQNR